MADPEVLKVLKSGPKTWNDWRSKGENFRDPDLRNANLRNADLRNADLARAYLIGADLRNAYLNGAHLNGAHLIGAHLAYANLNAANLIGAHLADANLYGADLRNADLTGANLHSADLVGANLTGANLTRANLIGAYLNRADLTGANLTRADLAFANLTTADVTDADFTGTAFGRTVFGDQDLSASKSLNDAIHGGPSTIGIDTLYISKRNIPEEFLRGAGVSKEFITYARSLVGQAIEFYSCFISYSTADQEFADRLYADLQSKGVRCWFAPHNIKGGKKIHEQIDEAIRLYDKLLLILSPSSMDSEWVNAEIAKARKRESREKCRMLFPLRLVTFESLRDWECFDADTGKDSAREIREYFIPDFSTWMTDHDAYREAFDRLLSDLRSETHGQALSTTPPPASAR